MHLLATRLSALQSFMKVNRTHREKVASVPDNYFDSSNFCIPLRIDSEELEPTPALVHIRLQVKDLGCDGDWTDCQAQDTVCRSARKICWELTTRRRLEHLLRPAGVLEGGPVCSAVLAFLIDQAS